MAGDWIKMRCDLADDPAVIGIALACDVEEDLVVGKLHKLWAWADRQTTDGVAHVGASVVDRITGVDGFAAAMVDAGWLIASDSMLQFPDFEKHNGSTAKKRAATAQRVAAHRSRNESGNAPVTPAKQGKVTIPRPIRNMVFERDGNICVYCGRAEGETSPVESPSDGYLTCDHVIPESKQGATTLENLVTCCNACNRFKGSRTPEECGLSWPCDQGGKRYGSVTTALPREEKRREEKSNKEGARFVPPTVEDVRAYCLSRGNSIDPQRFVDHYESNGWMVGRTRMKDWKASVRTWEKTEAEFARAGPGKRDTVSRGSVDAVNAFLARQEESE